MIRQAARGEDGIARQGPARFAVALAALLCGETSVPLMTPAFAADHSLEGSIRYDFFAYPDRDSRDGTTENFIGLNLRARGRLGADLRYRVELRADADDAGYTEGLFDPGMRDTHRSFLDFPEAVLDWTAGPKLRVSIGRQIINWSGIDEIQPANLLTPLDESNILERRFIGAYAISSHVDLDPITFDLAVVPVAFQPTRLPQGRWRLAPDSVALHVDDPSVDLDETQVGVRIATRLSSLEAAAVAYVGRDMFPLFALASPGDASTPPTIVAHYSRTVAAGVTASYPLGDSWLLRAEGVFYSSPDETRDEFFQYVPLGIEYTRGDWRVVLNYLRYDRTSRGNGALSQGERAFYPSFLFGETRWDAGGRLRVRLRAGYDTEERFGLIEPEVSCRVWRQLRVTLNAAVILAPSSGTFDYFDLVRHEDRIGLHLEYFL